MSVKATRNTQMALRALLAGLTSRFNLTPASPRPRPIGNGQRRLAPVVRHPTQACELACLDWGIMEQGTYELRSDGMRLSPEDTYKLVSIARRHGALKVSLFGSFARGDADQNSDLDVLVELEPGRSLLDLVRLERALEEALGLHVDVVTPKSLHPPVLERVMAERKCVL